MISVNIALVLTLGLSQILDSTYPMFPMIGDTFTQLTANPSILIGIVLIVNTLTLVFTLIVWGGFVGINRILGTATGSNANADIDS
jgi:hypothetical protein